MSERIRLDLVPLLPGADAAELDEIALQLQSELREANLDGDPAPTQPAIAPSGVKGDPFTVGTLAISVLQTTLPKLFEFLQAWLVRGRDRTMRVKLTTGDASIELELPAGKQELEDVIAQARRGLLSAPGLIASSSLGGRS